MGSITMDRWKSGLSATVMVLAALPIHADNDMKTMLAQARDQVAQRKEAAVLIDLDRTPLPTKNFVLNSGFEVTGRWGRTAPAPGPTGWISGDKTVRFDPRNAKNGKYSVRLGTDGVGATGLQQSVPLEVGKTYTFSAWIKSRGLTTIRNGDNSVGVRIIDAGWHWSKTIRPPTPTTDWQRYSVSFTCPKQHKSLGKQRFSVKMHLPADEKGRIWVDDIQVEAGNKMTDYTAKSVQEFTELAKLVDLTNSKLQTMPEILAQLAPRDAALIALEEELVGIAGKLQVAAGNLRQFNDVDDQIWSQTARATRDAADRARELTYLTWWTNPWKRFGSHQAPTALNAEAVTLRLAVNDYQPVALMVTNVTAEPMDVRVRLMHPKAKKKQGRYTGHFVTPPSWATVRQALMVEPEYAPDSEYPSMLAALPSSQTMAVAPGQTRQIWIDVDTAGMRPGEYPGILELQPQNDRPQRDVRLTLKVEDVVLPEKVPAEVFCWGNYPLGMLGENPEMSQAEINRLHQPWLEEMVKHGINRLLMNSQRFKPAFNKEDTLAAPIDFAFWDKLFNSKRRYAENFVGGYSVAHYHMPKKPDEHFRKRFGAMMKAWTDHLANLGVTPNQMPFEIMDEPGGHKVEIFRTGTDVLRKVAPGWKTMAAISQKSPAKLKELVPMMDIMVVSPGLLPEADKVLRESAREIWTYRCAGTLEVLHPIDYYLTLPWKTWGKGYTGFGFFWTMSSMHSPRQNRYSPYYIGTDGPVPSRGWQAFWRGTRDWTYLHLLREAADQAEKAGNTEAAAKARKTMEQAVTSMTAETANADVAVARRIELLDALIETHAAK
jgi:hypothetical protein